MTCYIRILFVVLGIMIIAPSAGAEPEKKYAVGLVLTEDATTGDTNAGANLRLGPLFRIKSTPGWHPTFGLNWVMADLKMDTRSGEDNLGSLRLRPFLAGVSYTWVANHLTISPRVLGGYSFNRLRNGAEGSARDSLAWKPEIQVWHDLGPRAGVLVSVGYLIARPEVTLRTESNVTTRQVRADALRVQVGMAYAVF